MHGNRLFVVFLMMTISGLVSAATCEDCEKRLTPQAKSCQSCGRITFEGRKFFVGNKEWLASKDEPLDFVEAQHWVSSLGNGWRSPAIKELQELYRSGEKLPFKDYPRISLWSGDKDHKDQEGLGAGWLISWTDGKVALTSDGLRFDDFRTLAVRPKK